MKDIGILITLQDDNVTDYLILLESLICTNSKSNLILYIIGQNEDLRSYKKINSFVKKNSICNMYFKYSGNGCIGLEQFARSVIASPYILPNDIDKVLYLNANILVNGKIDKLWDFDMGHFLFAACENRWISRGANIGELEKVGKAETDIYYSTDVMLLSLHNIKTCLPDWCIDNTKTGGDECTGTLEAFLNRYLSAQVIEIKDKKYNTQLMSYRKVARKEKYTEAILINYDNIEMQDCKKNDIDENLYELWWRYAKLFGIGNKKEKRNIRERRKEEVHDKIGFSMDLLRFVLKKTANDKLNFAIIDQIEYLKKNGLWNSFYFFDKRKGKYEKKYRELMKGYKGAMVYVWPIGGAAMFFLTIICYKIMAKRDDVLHILIPNTLAGKSLKADNPNFYVHNEYVLKYMSNAYIPAKSEKDFVRYVISKYYYQIDHSQLSKFMPVLYEDSGGTYEEVKDLKVIQFSDIEIERGNTFLWEHNIDGKFACIVPRSSDYKKEYVITVGFNDYLSYRNGNIENYMKAVNAIKSAGYNLIQMGKVNRKSFPSECGILKFADVYDEFLDLYLFSKCDFVIGDSSGAMCIAALFAKPTVQANCELITSSQELMGYFEKGHDLFLPVKYWNEEKGCFLSLKEQLILEAKYKKKRFEEEIIRLGYKGISNSAEEIEMAAREMIDYILGNKKYTKEEIQLQNISRELVCQSAQKHGMRYPRCNFAVGFLKLNPWYLKETT